MKKELKIINVDTGEVLEEFKFDGGYNIVFTSLSDGGILRRVKKLDNAKFGDKHWIKNYIYRPIAEKLVGKYAEIGHVRPKNILFIEDMEWKKPNSLKPKSYWQARISMATKQFEAITGYDYILETRNYFIERMSREQIVALIYHELRHIDQYGDLQDHDIEDWDNMVATLGKDWAKTKSEIADLIEDDVFWRNLEPVAKQLDIFNGLKAVK
jgi:predicted metallopeptidase